MRAEPALARSSWGDAAWSAWRSSTATCRGSEVEAQAAEMPAADVGRALLRIWAMAMQGRFDEARRIVRRVHGRAAGAGPCRWASSRTRSLAPTSSSAAGDGRRGRADVARGVGRLRPRSASAASARRSAAALGELLARRGALDEAEAILDEAIGISTPDDWSRRWPRCRTAARSSRSAAGTTSAHARSLRRRRRSSTRTSTSPCSRRCGSAGPSSCSPPGAPTRRGPRSSRPARSPSARARSSSSLGWTSLMAGLESRP